MTTKLVNISAHISIDLAEKLQKIANFEERPKSYYIKKGLSKILEERLRDIQDYTKAKKTLKQAKVSNEKFVSFDEVFKGVK
jgi:predicted DNA-binding protein